MMMKALMLHIAARRRRGVPRIPGVVTITDTSTDLPAIVSETPGSGDRSSPRATRGAVKPTRYVRPERNTTMSGVGAALLHVAAPAEATCKSPKGCDWSECPHGSEFAHAADGVLDAPAEPTFDAVVQPCKRILELVDLYTEVPTSARRSDLRAGLLDEIRAALAGTAAAVDATAAPTRDQKLAAARHERHPTWKSLSTDEQALTQQRICALEAINAMDMEGALSCALGHEDCLDAALTLVRHSLTPTLDRRASSSPSPTPSVTTALALRSSYEWLAGLRTWSSEDLLWLRDQSDAAESAARAASVGAAPVVATAAPAKAQGSQAEGKVADAAGEAVVDGSGL